jgi:hypothetical protein
MPSFPGLSLTIVEEILLDLKDNVRLLTSIIHRLNLLVPRLRPRQLEFLWLSSNLSTSGS